MPGRVAPARIGQALALHFAGLATAIAVSLVHTAAMIGSGLVAAWVVYRWLDDAPAAVEGLCRGPPSNAC